MTHSVEHIRGTAGQPTCLLLAFIVDKCPEAITKAVVYKTRMRQLQAFHYSAI